MCTFTLFVLLSWFVLSKTDIVSISVARTKADIDNTTYTVEGQLTSTPGVFEDLYGSENGYGFTIQDSTAGIHVYIEEESFYNGDLSEYVIGRSVTITGTIDSNTGPLDNKDEGGVLRINPRDLNDIIIGDIVSDDNLIQPRVITPDEVQNYQGELVQIRNVNIPHLIVKSEYGTDWRAVDCDGRDTSIWVYYLWNDNGNDDLVVGQEYTITGIAAVFFKLEKSHVTEEEYEIWPRNDNDWKVDPIFCDTVSINVARTKADIDSTIYTVEGQLTSTPGVFEDLYASENGYGFTIQDSTAGIHVYIEEESFYNGDISKYVIGRSVTITGTIDSNTGPLDNKNEGGVLRINPRDLNDIIIGDMVSVNDLIQPKVITPDEVQNYQGELVQITNLNISHLIVKSKYGTDWRAVDCDGRATSIWVYHLWNDNGNDDLIVGTQYTIIGIAAVFFKLEMSHVTEEFYEIWPRTDNDWKVNEYPIFCDTVNINVARTKADIDSTIYTIEGQLTSPPGVFEDLYASQNGYGFTIQDSTAGIHVYIEDASFYNGDISKYDIGRSVTITGTIDSNTGPLDNKDEGGVLRINPRDLNDIIIGDMVSVNDLIQPRIITPDDVSNYQGELVQITNVNISHLIVKSKYGTDWGAVDCDGRNTSIWVYYLWNDHGNDDLIVGKEYNITGIAAVFFKLEKSHVTEQEYEIWPRTDNDWKVNEYPIFCDDNTKNLYKSNSVSVNYVVGMIVSVFLVMFLSF